MTATTRNQVFSAVHTIGGLLPADMLVRISEGKGVTGCQPADYRVIGSRSVRDDAERHWDYLRSAWTDLRDELPAAPEAEVPADPTGLGVRHWLAPLFGELGFGELHALGLGGIPADDGSKSFAISHRWNHVPIHLTPWHTSLDRRATGGAVPAQSLLQECLNRTDGQLWGVISNGRQLRLLRDSNALATASYVEFDLEAIFDGELFSEFVLLYRLLHVTRFTINDGPSPSTCWLERWRGEAIASGTRALDQLRDGVQKAITALGTGFLRQPANKDLRAALDVDAFHTALLRLVYRLIFLFVAEDRDALHPFGTPEETRRRYADYFSSARLRLQATRRRGTSHTDLYQSLLIVLNALGDENGRPELGLPGIGGIFDDTKADAPLRGLSLANIDLLAAVRHLARVRDGARWRRVDYRNIGAEELGSVYESLLESVPKHSAVDSTFELVDRLGNNRKKTGSYYTPSSLIEVLLDSALDPVIDDAQKQGEQRASAAGAVDPTPYIETELLAITVCDPACGSGHFLVAAARRIAKRVAAVREKNPEPTAGKVQEALHEVIGRCVYGVDLNPMAVALAKVALWLEALVPGRPLNFLDGHIKHGNGLIGATPALLSAGIPNSAFKFVEGDDEKYVRHLAKENARQRAGQNTLFDVPTADNTFAAELRSIAVSPPVDLAKVHKQATDYQAWENSPRYRRARYIADAWCATFMWRKTKNAPDPITEKVYRDLQKSTDATLPKDVHDEVVRLYEDYRFFHWHLAFPDIFATPTDDTEPASTAGFSCVLGNPPWDKLDFEDKKYFSVIDPSIAEIAGTARRTRITAWKRENPEAGMRYEAARRKQKSTFHFASSSGYFPLCSKGLTVKGVNSLQTDQLFAEQLTTIVDPRGRIGCVIPTGIAVGAGAQHLFGSLLERGAIASLFDFENRRRIFREVDSRLRFCLLSIIGHDIQEPVIKLAFYLIDTNDLDNPGRISTLTTTEIISINPNTRTLPTFRTKSDARIVASIHEHLPILQNEGLTSGNPWSVNFKRLFDMTDDSDVFLTQRKIEEDGLDASRDAVTSSSHHVLPLYEAKLIHHFDHRWNSYSGMGEEEHRRLSANEKQHPENSATPRYWVTEDGFTETTRRGKTLQVFGVTERLKKQAWHKDWLCGWRDICRATDERTAIAAFLPRAAAGHTLPLMFPRVSTQLTAALIAAQSSLVVDFVSRQKVGGIHMSLMIWKQLPVPTPSMLEPHTPFITPRVLELVYTAYDMAGLAKDLDDHGQPFQWDEDRRAQIRAELDAYFFHLYDIDRPDVDYILESFQTESGGGLKNNEIAKYGTYRTKDLVLAEYDRMTASLTNPLVDGENYTSTLVPPPGHGPRHPHRQETRD